MELEDSEPVCSENLDQNVLPGDEKGEDGSRKDLDDEITEILKEAGVSQNCSARQRVASLILSHDDKDVISYLIKRSKKPNAWQEILEYVKAIFNVLGPLSVENHKSKSAVLLVSMFVAVVDLVHSHGHVDGRVIDCVNFLIQEMEVLPRNLIPSVAECILSYLDNGGDQDLPDSGEGRCRLLELLPRCLGLVASADVVSVPKEGEEPKSMSGSQYREMILKRLLGVSWTKKIVTKMAGLLRELPLETGEMDGFLRKFFFHMKDADPQDLPSLAYQLLLLASKGFKRIVLTGLINLFNKMHTFETNRRNRAGRGQVSRPQASTDAFRQMEGTIVLHINFAVKQDPALGQELLYLVRTNSWPSTPFLVSVLLSIGRIQRFEQASFDLLKAAAVRSYKDCQQCRESRLAASLLGGKCLQTVREMEQSLMRTVSYKNMTLFNLGEFLLLSFIGFVTVMKLCFSMISNGFKSVQGLYKWQVQSSAFGWDHIIPSVVRLGFCLIESAGVGRPRADETSRGSDQVSSTQDLGIRVLTAAFEVHEMARGEIIEQCKCRILGFRPQHSAPIIRQVFGFSFVQTAVTDWDMPVLSLFQLVEDCPQLMLEHSARLKECLDYLTFLSSTSASSLVRAICPLFQLSRDLQDYTILVLRKAMFGREESARMTAVQGLLELVISEKKARVYDSDASIHRNRFSEASCSQSSSQVDRIRLSNRINTNLLQDLLGLLRRCLSQQVNVRETLYQGLPKLLKMDPDSAENIFDLLFPHFSRFYLSGPENTVAFELDACVVVQNEKVRVVEPLDCLLSCIHQLLVLQPPGSATTASGHWMTDFSEEQEVSRMTSGESLAMAFKSIRKTIHSSSLGDFYRDKTLDFSLETPEGEKCIEQARLLLGVLEVLMDSAVHDSLHQPSPVKRAEVAKELESYLDLHDSLVLILGQKPAKNSGKTGSKGRGKGAKSKDFTGQPGGKAVSFLVPRNMMDKRKPLLSTECMVHLLSKFAGQLNSRYSVPAGSQLAGNSNSQSVHEEYKVTETRIVSFTLQNCERQLRVFSVDSTDWDPLRAGDSDWKQLAAPLFKVVCVLSLSGTNAAPGTQDGAKEKGRSGRGKKSDSEMTEGLLFLSVKCLDETLKIAVRKGCAVDLIRQINTECGDHSEVPADKDDENQGSDEESDLSANHQEEIYSGSDAKLVHNWLCREVRPILQALFPRACYPEIEVFASMYLRLGNKLPQVLMKKHGEWAHLLCKEQGLRHVGASRGVIGLALCLNTAPQDFIMAQSIAAELLKVMGSDELDAIEISEKYLIVNEMTKTAIGGLLLQRTDSSLVELEWLTSKLKVQASLEVDQKTPVHPGSSQRNGSSQRAVLEDTLYTRLESIVTVLHYFTTMSLTAPLAEQLLKTATRFYKCLAAVTRLRIAPKGVPQVPPSSRFQRLAEITCKKLTAPLYIFMSAMQRDQQEVSFTKSRGTVSQIKREGRTIPNLIYHIEECERYLIQLSKVSKVNLLRAAKRSTARDFKIMEKDGKRRKTAHTTVAEDEAVEEHNGEGEQEGSAGEADEREDSQAAPSDEVLEDNDENDQEEVDIPMNGYERIPQARANRVGRQASRVIPDSDESE
ncbi:hypothetical protein R1flu_024496 [Riccia fluitans]|uniref:Fanconi anemia group I protein n=1 Tax=Riccia fluitans TaxID=41844 RepID=A0ABD1XV36_9MARC